MAGKVDSGKIFLVKRVQILEEDTVYSLTLKCYAALFDAFCEIISKICKQEPLPESKEVWLRKPYTRKQLNDLCTIDLSLPEEEIKKRVRATTYPGYEGPYVNLNGQKVAFRVYDKRNNFHE
jgi:methionyl-tRNA formyltransferase